MSKATKVIALNVIQRTIKAGEYGDRARGIPGTKPEIQTIEPGAVFMASNEVKAGHRRSEYDELLATGAIRDYTQADHAVFSRLSNVIGGGEFEDEEGTAQVTQKVIKPKKPAKEVEAAAAAEAAGSDTGKGSGEGAIKSGKKAPAKAKATEGQSDQGAGDGDGGGAGNEGDGEGDDADSVV